MVGLLDLPSELLFNIIHIVLSSPTVQSENGKRYRTSWWNTTDRNLYCVLSPDHSKRPKAVDLLLVSRKIQIETTEYLSKAPRNFEIDIAVVDDHWLWPTRRVIPVRKLDETIERLDINIIPCCTEGQRALQTGWDDYMGPNMFDLSMGSFVPEALLAPLSYFLLYPQTDVCIDRQISKIFRGLEIWLDPPSDARSNDQSNNDQNLPVTRISTVAIFVSTLAYGNGNEVLSLAAVPSRKIQGLAHLDFEQLYPVDRAKSERYLRGLSSYIEQWARYWSTERVGQRIGRIQFYLNEEIWKELDFESCVTDI